MSSFAKYHDELVTLMAMHRGETFSAAQITDMFETRYPDLRSDFVQPSDHCVNHTCKGACWCSSTENALFERSNRNTYFVR